MSDDHEPGSLERRAQELLRASADGLDGHIRSRLTRARTAAVEAARRSRTRFGWRTWVPAGALAGAAALALVLWSGAPRAPGPATPHNSFEDLDLIVTSESFELLEDLEFYEWVAAGDPDGASSG
ncbi:MAG TPA: hypothetical protein VJ764_04250 [Steroidobacteraceae bacterium]|nr:hypothetical protein [Steroidobacteraceae bacterium]